MPVPTIGAIGMQSSRRSLLGRGLALAACACVAATPARAGGKFICPPCGCAMDGREFDAPGLCPACGMTLVAKPPPAPFEPTTLQDGRGLFEAAGGVGREAQRIGVHYYKPRTFTPRSPVLLVLPGAGRDADEYRDAWVEAAEAHGVLVAALGYPEADYDFAAYQMGGVIRNLRLPPGAAGQSVVRLRDEDIGFDLNPRRETWLFNDFDRIFALLARAAGSERERYDLFGHSAGGQILHRLTLFQAQVKADRIVAANSGFYTLPDLDVPQPFGLKGTGATPDALAASFGRRLTLLLGEKDDGDEAGGIQLRTPTADRQGVGRLARGRYFFEAGRARARSLGVPFEWRLEVVPNVGHDYRRMTAAAARLLYG